MPTGKIIARPQLKYSRISDKTYIPSIAYCARMQVDQSLIKRQILENFRDRFISQKGA